MNIFSMDSAFYRFISRLGELIELNILFLVSCIGIITIGPAVSAMYTVLLKLVRDESGYVVREYRKAFRNNFKQAAVLGILFGIAGAILYFDILFSDMIEGYPGAVLKVVFLFLGILYIGVLSYVFAVQSRFENTLLNTLRNSFWMAVGYLPFTISVLVIEALPIFVVCVKPELFWYILPVMATIGVASLSYACAVIFNYIFKNYMPENEEERQ